MDSECETRKKSPTFDLDDPGAPSSPLLYRYSMHMLVLTLTNGAEHLPQRLEHLVQAMLAVHVSSASEATKQKEGKRN